MISEEREKERRADIKNGVVGLYIHTQSTKDLQATSRAKNSKKVTQDHFALVSATTDGFIHCIRYQHDSFVYRVPYRIEIVQ